MSDADTTAHILLVEDDEALSRDLIDYLSSLGFKVAHAATAQAARDLIDVTQFDLCLLDILLPGTSGRVLCSEIAERFDMGIIIVSALSDSETVIAMLEMGADDYLVKSFEMGELSARMRAVLRRRSATRVPRDQVVNIGPWRFDRAGRRLTHADAGHSITLTTTEAAVLRFLTANRGVVFSREDLLAVSRMRQHGGSGDRSVDTMIQRLRRKIEPDPKMPTLIVSVYGKGYRLDA